MVSYKGTVYDKEVGAVQIDLTGSALEGVVGGSVLYADNIAPTPGTITITLPNGEAYTPYTWTDQDLTITVVSKGSDADSGVKSESFYIEEISGGDDVFSQELEFGVPTVLSREGAFYVGTALTDNATNINIDLTNVYIDKNPPATPTITNSSGGNWTAGNVTITATSSDAGSGIARIEYSWDQSNWSTSWSVDADGTDGSVQGTWSEEMDRTLYVRAVDESGKVSGVASTPIRIQKTPPVWTYVSKDVYYSSSNDVGTDNYANASRTIVITFRGTGSNSNVTSTLTSDAIAVSVNGTNVANSNKSLSLTGSGTATVTGTLTIKNVTGDGALNVVIPAGTLRDTVGNTSAAKTITTDINVTVDNTKPVLNLAITSPAAGYYKAGQAVTITATYNEDVYKDITAKTKITSTANAPAMKVKFGSSGTGKGSASCTSVSGRTFTYSYTITAGDNGRLAIESLGTVYDIAGNSVAASNVMPSQELYADTAQPTATGLSIPAYTNTGKFTATAQGVTDNVSGVNRVQWYLTNSSMAYVWSDQASTTQWTKSIDVSSLAEGRYYIGIVIHDNAGNSNDTTNGSTSASTIGWKDFVYDKTPPTITVSPDKTTSSVGNYVKTQSVTITASDSIAGLASGNSYQYYLSKSSTALEGGSWTNYTSGSAVTLGSGLTGKYYLFVKAVSDNAGNVSSSGGTVTTVSGVKCHRYGTYNFDNSAPTYTSVEIKNVDRTGYDVYLYGVSDGEGSGINRVQFPTWTQYNGQDDINLGGESWVTNPRASGTNQGGGTWYFRVNVSDHNNEEGYYNTHIYIYDNLGQQVGIGEEPLYVDRTPPSATVSPEVVTDGLLKYFDADNNAGDGHSNSTNNWTNLVASTGGGGLPAGYERLEYIQSTGTQWIDTGWKPSSMDFEIQTQFVITGTGVDQSIFGAGQSGVPVGLSLNLMVGSNLWQMGVNNSWANVTHSSCTTNQSLSVVVKGASGATKLIVNGQHLVTNTQTTFSPSNNMGLFIANCQPGDTGYYPTEGKIYYFKAYENGNLIRDMIPCKNSSGVLGLYDLVEGKFYTNAGTGTFIAGGAFLPSGYEQLSYIESSGTQYIDTGVVYSLSNSYKTELQLSYNTTALADQIFGFNGHRGMGVGLSTNENFWECTGAIATAGTIYNLQWTKHGANYSRTINGTVYSGEDGNTTVWTGNMLLFAATTSSADSKVNYYCNAKLYDAKIYVNGTLVRDFIPCKNSSGTVGLYDLVEKKFYGNSGTGSFIPGSELPGGYRQLSYIEATGTQWINTGIKGNARWEFDLQFTNTTKRQLMGYGGYQDEYWGTQTDGKYGLFAGSTIGSSGDRDTIIHNYGEGGTYYIEADGERLNAGGGRNVAEQEYQLFNIMSSADYVSYAKLYGLRCIQNGKLIREFIPCQNSSGAVGLYDLVGRKFYGNAGTGTFKSGTGDLPVGYQQLEYIQSTGTQWIDTGFSAPNGFIVDTDVQTSGELTGIYIVGAHNPSSPWGRNGICTYPLDGVNWGWEIGLGDTCPVAGTSARNSRYTINASTVKGNSYLKINGTSIVTSSDTSSRSSDNIRVFGTRYHGANTWSGKLYSMKLYNSSNVLVRDFVPCKNPSGTIGLYDKLNGVFYANNGTGTFGAGKVIETMATRPGTAPIATNEVAGLSGGTWSNEYLTLDGTDDWVNLGQISFTNQVTLEATVELNQIQSSERIIIANYESGGLGLGLRNGIPEFQVYVAGRGYTAASMGTALATNTKYHLAGTYDGTNIKFYLNGELKKTVTAAGTIQAPGSNTVMAIGTNPAGTNPDLGSVANIDVYDARIYNKALTQAQIQQNIDATTSEKAWSDSANGVVVNAKKKWAQKHSVTAILSDNFSGFDAGKAYRYGWSTSRVTPPSNYKTVTPTNPSGATSLATATLDVTNTDELTGKYFLWVSTVDDGTLNDMHNNQNDTFPIITMGRAYFDNILPTITISPEKNTEWAGVHTASVTISDADSGLAAGIKLKYGWARAITNDSGVVTSVQEPTEWITQTFSNAAGANSVSFTATTAATSTPVPEGHYYLWISPDNVTDLANNKPAIRKSTGTFLIDRTAPSISVTAKNETWKKVQTATVTLNDSGSGLQAGAVVKYGWSTSTSTEPITWIQTTLSSYTSKTHTATFTASTENIITQSSQTGKYYLWVRPVTCKDVAQNVMSTSTTIKSSGTFWVDRTSPKITTNYSPVTDGLIRHYDADINTGSSHSSTTTTWTDLTGNDSGYQQLEYIKSTGTQWINSGVVIESNTWVDTDLMFDSAFDYNMMFGSWTNSFAVSLRGVNTVCAAVGGVSSQNIGSTTTTGVKYNIVLGPGKGYVQNGVTTALGGATNSISGNTILLFGASAYAEDIPHQWNSFGVGKIYSFKIYKGTTGNSQNSTLLRNFVPCKNTNTGVIGLYDTVEGKFYGNSGTGTFTAGPANNGTVNGGATWSDDYLTFDGSNDWVNLGQTLFTNQYTLEATVEIPSIQSGFRSIFSNQEAGGTALALNNGKITAQPYTTGAGTYVTLTADTAISTNTKHHLVTTYDGTNIRLYVDGTLVKSTTSSGTIKAPNSNTIMSMGAGPSGNTANGEFFNGKIYNARIYNKALTAAQITQNYNASTSSKTWKKEHNVTVTLSDAHRGLATGASIKYGWSTSPTTSPSSYSTASINSYSANASTATFTAKGTGLTGRYFLWIVPTTLKDNAESGANIQTASTITPTRVYFDNTGPTVPTYVAYHTADNTIYQSGGWTNAEVRSDISSTDEHSGIAKIQYKRTSDNGATWSDWADFGFGISGGLKKTGTYTWSGTENWELRQRDDKFYFKVIDKAGNESTVTLDANKPMWHIRYDFTDPYWSQQNFNVDEANKVVTVDLVGKDDHSGYRRDTLTSDNIKVYMGDTLLPNVVKQLDKTATAGTYKLKLTNIEESTRQLGKRYQVLEYIQSSGTQYINTGYKPTSENLKIAMSFYQPTSADGQSLFGAEYGTHPNRQWPIVAYGGAGIFSHYIGTSTGLQTVTTAIGTKHDYIVHVNNGTLTVDVDGTVVTTEYAGSVLKTYDMYVFANNVNGSASQLASMRLYAFQMYDNGVLVRDFVPCKDTKTGAVGLYDLVEDVFYRNAGSGSFTAGAVIGELYNNEEAPTQTAKSFKEWSGNLSIKVDSLTLEDNVTEQLENAYKILPYIESTGTQYINPGVKWDTNDIRIKGNYSYNELMGHSSIFGTQGHSNGSNLILREESGTLRWWMGQNNSVNIATVSAGQRIDFDFVLNNAGSYSYDVQIDNGALITGSGTFSNAYDSNPIYLFDTQINGGRGSVAASTITCKAKLYEMKIWKNGTLVRDFIPCMNSSGEIGLYDYVEGKFYKNAGTGEFTTDSSKLVDKELSYIEATGTQWINTGVKGTARWEFDVQFTNTTRRQLMGYWGSHAEYWGSQTDGKYGLFAGSTIGSSGDRDTIIHNYGEGGSYYLETEGQKMSIEVTDVTSREYQLFNIMSSADYVSYAKLYGLRCIQNGKIIRDFVPTKKADGTVGLYDKINGVFYGNAGTGTFVAGAVTGILNDKELYGNKNTQNSVTLGHADVIEPEFTYKHSESTTIIGHGNGTVNGDQIVKVTFDVIDKYFSSAANLKADDITIKIVDEDKTVDPSKITKTLRKVQDIKETVNGVANTKIGERYELTITGLDEGTGFDYSGPMSLSIAGGKVTDTSGNTNHPHTITIGIDSTNDGLPSNSSTRPYLPEGYTHVEGNLSSGIVIQDKKGNQYVWVEVPKTSTVYKTAGLNIKDFTDAEYTKIENDLHNYVSTYRGGLPYKDQYYSGQEYTEAQYNNLKKTMLKSIYKNGGFYIGRYEAGIDGQTPRTGAGSATQTPVIKKDAYPYNYVTLNQSQTLATKFTTDGYTSSLMFGVQRDLVLKYLETKGQAQSDVLTDSRNIGNFKESSWEITGTDSKYSLDNGPSWSSGSYTKSAGSVVIHTTGAVEKYSKQNIYDFIGNQHEWTMEYSFNTSSPSVLHAGSSDNTSKDHVAKARKWIGAPSVSASWGSSSFRTALYRDEGTGADEAVSVPYIPKGYSVVDGTSLQNGFVVQDASGNQFVWIEVPKTAAVYKTAGINIKEFTSAEVTKIENDLKTYTTTYRAGTSATDQYMSMGGLTSAQYNELKKNALVSIYKNGGFYVGRYEVGTETARTASGNTTQSPVIKQNAYTYNYVNFDQAQEVATRFTTQGYTSSLMFGVQWDLILKYLENKGAATVTELTAGNKQLGNYTDSAFTIKNTDAKYTTGGSWLSTNSSYYSKGAGTGAVLTTGSSDAFKKQNIYDLFGNNCEWTLEYSSNSSTPRVIRGGSAGSQSTGFKPNSRVTTASGDNYHTWGFRVMLFATEKQTPVVDVVKPVWKADIVGAETVNGTTSAVVDLIATDKYFQSSSIETIRDIQVLIGGDDRTEELIANNSITFTHVGTIEDGTGEKYKFTFKAAQETFEQFLEARQDGDRVYRVDSGKITLRLPANTIVDESGNVNDQLDVELGGNLDTLIPEVIKVTSDAPNETIVFDVTDRYLKSSKINGTAINTDAIDADGNIIDLSKLNIDLSKTNTDNIHVFIDGSEVSSVTKTITNIEVLTEKINEGLHDETIELVGFRYTLKLSDFEENPPKATAIYGDYSNWSGNVLIKIDANTAIDKYGLGNDERTLTGQYIDLNSRHLDPDFMDDLKPDVTYKYSESTQAQPGDIDYQGKTFKMVFEITDRYFENSTLDINDLTILIGGETPDWTKVGKTLASKDTTYGKEYTLTLTGLEQEEKLEGKEYVDYSGVVTVSIPAGKATDASGNGNDAKTITSGIDVESDNDLGDTSQVVDVVEPRWETVGQLSANMETQTAVITTKVTDRYLPTDDTLRREDIKVLVNGTETTNGIEINVEEDTTASTEYQKQYIITITGFPDSNLETLSVVIVEGAIPDQSGNLSREKEFALVTALMKTENEKNANSLFLANPYGIQRQKVEQVIFVDSIDTTQTNMWDVSSRQNESIMAWYEQTANGTYKVYIGCDVIMNANKNSSYLFSYIGYDSACAVTGDRADNPIIKNLKLLQTDIVTDMSFMFAYTGYSNMKTLDLGDNFSTQNVYEMEGMFSNCGNKKLEILDLGPQFTSIPTVHQNFVTNCGNNNTVIYVSESIYAGINKLKLGQNSNTTISTSGAKLEPMYRPEWTKVSSSLNEDGDMIVVVKGSANKTFTVGGVEQKYLSNVVSVLAGNRIKVYVDGELAENIDIAVNEGETYVNEETGMEEVKYEVTLSDFVELTRQNTKLYTEWSGNIALQMDNRTLIDSYGNGNLAEVEIDTSGTKQRIEVKDGLTNKETENTMFVDTIAPEFTYKYADTVINYNDKVVTVVFDITDKYFSTSELTTDQLASKIKVLVDDVDTTENITVKKTLTKISDHKVMVNGVEQKVGERYQLVIEGLEQESGNPFRDYSGPMDIVIDAGVATDHSGNTSNGKVITIGVDDPNASGNQQTGVIVDVVDPQIFIAGEEYDFQTDTVIITILATDKYIDKTVNLIDSTIEITAEDGRDLAEIYETSLTKTESAVGFEYKLKIYDMREEIKFNISIPDRVIKDTSNNYNEAVDFEILADFMKPRWKYISSDSSQLDTNGTMEFIVQAEDRYMVMDESSLETEDLDILLDGEQAPDTIGVNCELIETTETDLMKSLRYKITLTGLEDIGTVTLAIPEGKLVDEVGHRSNSTTISFSKATLSSQNYVPVTYHYEGEGTSYVNELLSINNSGTNVGSTTYMPSSMAEIWNHKNTLLAEEAGKSFKGWAEAESDGDIIYYTDATCTTVADEKTDYMKLFKLYDEIPVEITHLRAIWQEAKVIFVSIDGDNANDGLTPDTPVATLEGACEKFSDTGTAENQIIVLISPIYWFSSVNTLNKNATITSLYGGVDYSLSENGNAKLNIKANLTLNGDITFDNITIESDSDAHILNCNNNDVIIGRGVKTPDDSYTFAEIVGGNDENHKTRIEAGKYGNINVGGEVVLGNKKDGARGQHTKLTVTGYFTLGESEQNTNSNIYLYSGTFTGANNYNENDEYATIYLGSLSSNTGGNVKFEMFEGIVNGNVYGGATAENKSMSFYGGQVLPAENGGIFGQGASETFSGDSEIILSGRFKTTGNVFGGSNATDIGTGKGTGNTSITINSASAIIEGDIYGGSNNGAFNGSLNTETGYVNGTANITITTGTIDSKIYGGGYNSGVKKTNIEISGGTITTDIYGGAYQNNVEETNVTITGVSEEIYPTIKCNIYGGSHDESGFVVGANKTNIYIKGGAIGDETLDRVYGGSKLLSTTLSRDTILENTNIVIENSENSQSVISSEIYGGGVYDHVGTTNIDIISFGSTSVLSVYGGSDTEGIIETTNVNLKGATVRNLYGGSKNAGQVNNSNVNLYSGKANYVYGAGYGVNSTNATVNLNGATVTTIFGGAGSTGIVNNTNVNLLSGTVTNVYGGNNMRGYTLNSTVTINGDAEIKENLFGGGYLSSIGNASNTGSSTVNIVKGTVNVDVNAGSKEGVVYGTSNINIGRDTVDTSLEAGDIILNGYIYGSGSSNKAPNRPTNTQHPEEVNYDYNYVSVQGDVNININGNGHSTFEISGSIFGAGNAATYSGTANINIKNFGTQDAVKTITSIQRASNLVIDNSHLEFVGTEDITNTYVKTGYALNRIDNLTVSNNTYLHMRRGFNIVKEFNSIKGYDGNGNPILSQVSITGGVETKNVDNRLYVLEGINLIFATEDGDIYQNPTADTWGEVNGMTFFGMYALDRNANKMVYDIYDPNYEAGQGIEHFFVKGSFVEGLHKENHVTTVDGFYTNIADTSNPENITITKQYIDVTGESYYYDWIIGEDTVAYEVTLTGSTYSRETFAEILLDYNYEEGTTYTVSRVSLNALKTSVNLIDETNIPNIASSEDIANNNFALIMQTGRQGWLNSGKTNIMTENNGGVQGNSYYVADSSGNYPTIDLRLINSLNITKQQDLGKVSIELTGKSRTGEDGSEGDVFTILITVNLKTSIEEELMEYVPSFTNKINKDLQYTNDSEIDLTYLLYHTSAETVYSSGDYRVLTSTYKLPAGTKVTLYDKSFDDGINKIYYYHINNDNAYDTVETYADGSTRYIYKLSHFIEMGSTTTSNVFPNDNNRYYNNTTGIASEKFNISANFRDANITVAQQDIKMYLELRDSAGTVKCDEGDSIITFDLLPNKNATMNFSISNNNEIYNISSKAEIEFDFNAYMKDQTGDGARPIIDTVSSKLKKGFAIEILDGNNRVTKPDIIGLNVLVDGEQMVYGLSDGTVRKQLGDGYAVMSNKLKLSFIPRNVETGRYKVKVYFVASDDGEYYATGRTLAKEFYVDILGSDFAIDVDVDNLDRIINKTEDATLAGDGTIDYTVELGTRFAQTNVRVAVYKRNVTYVDNQYSEVSYTEERWTRCFANELETPEDQDLVAGSQFEYMLIPKGATLEDNKMELPAEFKSAIKTGEYKLEFRLYNGDTLINTVGKTFVVVN